MAASAGTGKTETLARRVIGRILDPREPCRIDQFLVATFTRAAAAELRARIGRMLREQQARTAAPGQRSHLAQQLARLDAADIGTIDAWCLELVRANCDAAGVDPGLRMLDSGDAAVLRAAELDALLDEVLADEDDPDGALLRGWLTLTAPPGARIARELIRELNAARERMLDPAAWFTRVRAAAGRPAAEMLVQGRAALGVALGARLEEAEGWLAGEAGWPAGTTAMRQDLVAALRDARAQLGDPADLERVSAALLVRLDHLLPDKSKTPYRWVSKLLRRALLRPLERGWGPQVLEVIAAGAERVQEWTRGLLALEQRYHERLVARKRERAAYEFHDVARMALELLGAPDGAGGWRPTPLAQQQRARYVEVIVDEFQDTSPLQVALVQLVTRDAPPNRFAVGDIKQSIYGFRDAEPALFRAAMDAIRAGREPGAVHPLRGNFRAHADVLGPVNEICAALFDERLGGVPYDAEARLEARRSEPEPEIPHPAARVTVHTLPGQVSAGEYESDELPLEQIEREALVIAEEIRRLQAENFQVPRRQPDGTLVSAPFTPADCVVLLRVARQNAPKLAGKLREVGVHAVIAGRDAVLECPEVRDVVAILELVANARQDIPWAAYLRGPAVGLDEGQLLAIRRSAPHGSFADAVWRAAAGEADIAPALRASLAGAVGRLRAWRRQAGLEDVGAFVRRVVRESDIRLFARARPSGAHRESMLDAFERLADDFAQRPDADVGGFVDHLDTLARSEQALAETPASADAVRVMTVHAAKGLEFPVVFLANAGGPLARRGGGPPLRVDERLGLDLALLDQTEQRDYLSPTQRLQELARTDRELSEELRLLYVALTRARERIVVIGHAETDIWPTVEQTVQAAQTVPLPWRLGARNTLEWVLMGVAAATLQTGAAGGVEVRRWEAAEVDALRAGFAEPDAAEPEPVAPSRRWVAAALRLIESDPASPAAAVPAVRTASDFKTIAFETDAPLGGGGRAATLPPLDVATDGTNAAGSPAAGAARGLVVHRFLEHADPSALRAPGGLEREVARLVASGMLPAEAAAELPLEDLAWWVATDLFGELATAEAGRLRRELPFVYRLATPYAAPVLVRGTMDCLLAGERPLLVDYKTDRVKDAAERARRAAGYAVQLRIYAAAATALLGREVERLRLVWLSERLVEEVMRAPVTFADLDPSAASGGEPRGGA